MRARRNKAPTSGTKMDASTTPPTADSNMPPVGGTYAKYVLFVLVLVYMVNFIDRSIISILAEDIKRDLQL